MDRARKESVVAELNQIFKDSGVVVVAHYAGLSVADMSELRLRMRKAGGAVRVAKNKLVKIALEGNDCQSMAKLFSIVKAGFKAYKQVIKAIGEYMASTKVGRWTEDKLKDLDAFLAKHPKTKRIAGLAVAGILIYIWLNMTFTGNADYDFDMGDMIMALGGGFTLSTIFAGPDGMALLTLFATGVIGLSFPWPGPQHIQFVGAVLYGSAKLVGQKLRKEK